MLSMFTMNVLEQEINQMDEQKRIEELYPDYPQADPVNELSEIDQMALQLIACIMSI